MPRILIAGCGYVGAATADLFHHQGWDVEGWTASPDSAAALQAKPYPVRAVDLTDRTAIKRAAGAFDAAVQCASSRGGGSEAYRKIYLQAAEQLRAAFPQALLLFTSSTSVYAQTDGEWVTEESAAEPAHETGRVLRETEELVLGGGGIVARLAGLYGPGRSALLDKFLAGTAVIGPDAERFVNQVHRDDAAAGLFLLVQLGLTGQADGPRLFNISGNHPISQRACYEWLAERLARPVPPASSTAPLRRRGNSNKRVSSARLHALGWTPRYPTFQSAMAESILPARPV
ncbi:MAG: NAD-dependent epimerase/dehydratase family protein [Chthoniobacterales bacterium]